MSTSLHRRRFLGNAGAGIAAGVVTAAGLSGGAAEEAPLLPPLDPNAKADKSAQAGAQTVCCEPAAKPIYACSGAADVGKIADLAARKLTESGAGKMSCLAGIGGRVPGLLEIAKSARKILVLDGCPLHCGRNTLEHAGFAKFEHVCLADLGLQKGKTPVTDENIAVVVARGTSRLQS